MQFAGQRTDMDLHPIGEPHNFLIKLSEDVLPDPDAVLVTGITPQQTIADGLTEAEFLKIFHTEITTPNTIFTGYNTIRFDDEFMRYLHYRNFYDPYEWQYQDGRSRWDLLDVVRMMRALRPEGIKWPIDKKGQPTNRLELLTALNELEHETAHDALSDVRAAIAVAHTIKNLQPKLFDFLLTMRLKQKVAELVLNGQPFVYTSGKYSSEYEKTTIAVLLAEHPKRQGALVYDLRYDPQQFTDLKPTELAEAWRRRKDDPGPRLPVKTLQYNRCPAVAPLNVLDDASQKRLNINLAEVQANFNKLKQMKTWTKQVLGALDLLDEQQQARLLEEDRVVDNQLYDGFFDTADKKTMNQVRSAPADKLADLEPHFKDGRLKELLPLYKARNFPKTLTDKEHKLWERYRTQKLLKGKEQSRLARYFARLTQLGQESNLTSEQQYLLEELQLYGQSLLPEDV